MMGDSLSTPEFFLLMTMAVVSPALLLWMTIRSIRFGRRVSAAVFGATLVHETLLVSFPVAYSIATQFKLDQVNGAVTKLPQVYVGEALFVTLFAGAAAFFVRPGREGVPKADSIGERVIITCLIIGALWLNLLTLFGAHQTVDDIWHHTDFAEYAGWSDAVIEWFKTFVRWPGLAAASLVAADRNRPALCRALGALCVIVVVLVGLANGYRGGITWGAGFLIIGSYMKANRRVVMAACAIIAVTAPLFSWMKSDMVYYNLFAPDGITRFELLPHVWEREVASIKGTAEAAEVGLVESLADRAQGARNSTGLYGLHDEGNGAGFKPIIGALWMPIPRLLWPDKPVGGSIDSRNEGAAIFQVQRLKPNTSPVEMGPILASAHAYWEGGWLFLVAAGLLTGLLWGKLTTAVDSRNDIQVAVVMSFLAALPIDGLYSALNPLYTFILVGWKTAVPMGVLIGFVHWLDRLRSPRMYPLRFSDHVRSTTKCVRRRYRRSVIAPSESITGG